jgi:glycosyltransferase involved in cell wall biosynthesis
MSATVFSLSVLCPCYNEEAALPAFFEAIEPVLESITGRYEIVCVDYCS